MQRWSVGVTINLVRTCQHSQNHNKESDLQCVQGLDQRTVQPFPLFRLLVPQWCPPTWELPRLPLLPSHLPTQSFDRLPNTCKFNVVHEYNGEWCNLFTETKLVKAFQKLNCLQILKWNLCQKKMCKTQCAKIKIIVTFLWCSRPQQARWISFTNLFWSRETFETGFVNFLKSGWKISFQISMC